MEFDIIAKLISCGVFKNAEKHSFFFMTLMNDPVSYLKAIKGGKINIKNMTEHSKLPTGVV